MPPDIEIEPASDPDIRLVDYVGGELARAERQRGDHALVDRIRAGDVEAFTSLYSAYRSRLFGLAYEYTRDGDDADDLVEDVFARLWERRTRWKLETTIAAYLCTSVRNRATDLRRRVRSDQRRREELTGRVIRGAGALAAVQIGPSAGAEVGDVAFNSGERRLYETDLRAAIDAAMAGMPSRCREVFQVSKCMYGDEALSYAEIGEVLGIVPSTVRQHLIRALDILEAQLNAAGWTNVLRRHDRGRSAPWGSEP